MNKNQKYVLATGIILVIVVFIFWQLQGGEILTKTQVLTDKTTDLDRMLGVENKQYIDKFVFGLFPSGIEKIAEIFSVSSFVGLIFVISGVLIYLFRNKKKGTK